MIGNTTRILLTSLQLPAYVTSTAEVDSFPFAQEDPDHRYQILGQAFRMLWLN